MGVPSPFPAGGVEGGGSSEHPPPLTPRQPGTPPAATSPSPGRHRSLRCHWGSAGGQTRGLPLTSPSRLTHPPASSPRPAPRPLPGAAAAPGWCHGEPRRGAGRPGKSWGTSPRTRPPAGTSPGDSLAKGSRHPARSHWGSPGLRSPPGARRRHPPAAPSPAGFFLAGIFLRVPRTAEPSLTRR